MVQLPPVPHVSQVILNWSIQGQDAKNVFHYTQGPDLPGPDATVIGPRIAATLTTGFWSQFPTGTLLTSITVIPLDQLNAAGTDYTVNMPLHGTATQVPCPNNLAALVSWKTNKRGRSYRGRTYLGGLSTVAQNINNLWPGSQTALQTWANSMIVLSGTTNANLCIVSYYGQKVLRNPPTYELVTSAVVRSELATQRRRMP